MHDEIHIRMSYGDLDYLRQGIVCAIQRRHLADITGVLWAMRETRRRGGWKPFTLGDMIVLWRKERWFRTEPRLRGPYPAPWRHRAQPTRQDG